MSTVKIKIISEVMNDRHQFDDLHQPIAMQERQPIIAQGAGLFKLWGGSKTALRFTGVKVTPDIAALCQKIESPLTHREENEHTSASCIRFCKFHCFYFSFHVERGRLM